MSVAERIAKYTVKGAGCWEWSARKTRKGYGQLRVDGKSKSAHRLVWELAYGTIPEGMLVCHKCDNPGCVNPDHMFLGTPQDNMTDKMSKGRYRGASGERQGLSRLTEDDVRDIRHMYSPKRGVAPRLAKIFGVAAYTIHCVGKYKTWRHV